MTGPTRAEFAITLRDDMSPATRNASRGLDVLRSKIESETKGLRAMQAALSRLKGGTTGNTAAFRRLSDQIAAQRARIARAQAEYVELGGTFGETRREGGGLAGIFGSLADLGGGGVAIVRRLVEAYAALVTGIAAATAALVGYALASADARRSELLHLEGLTTIRRYYRLAAGTGAELQASIDRVSDSSALGRAEVSRYAETLYRAGLRGAQLGDALEAVSTVAAVQGDRMASRFVGMSAAAVRTGGSVRRLAEDVRARLGGLASRQALSLGRQFERLRESVGRIFGDVRIEGFLHALHDVVSLFSQSTETGRALRQIVTSIFSPLFDSVGRGSPLVRRFFQGAVISALQLTIAIGRARRWIVHTFGDVTLFRGFSALEVGRLAFVALAAAILTLAIPLAIVGASVLRFATWFGEAYQSALDLGHALGGTDWSGYGRMLVDGLLRSLQSGYDRIHAAVRGLADTASSAFRDALGIHSPSRVFERFGGQLTRGLEVGVDRGSSAVSSSVAELGGAVTSTGASALTPTGRGSRASSVSLAFGDVHVHVGQGGEAEGREAARAFRDELANVLEGVGIELGGAR